MKKNLIHIAYLLILIFISACSSDGKVENQVMEDELLFNQVGYTPHAAKKALIRTNSGFFKVLDSDGNKVLEGKPSEWQTWEESGDSVRSIDFSELNKAGNYSLQLEGSKQSYAFTISDRPLEELAKAALKSFYFNRTAMPIEPAFGGKWSRPAGHPDNEVYVHASAADQNRPEGTVISSQGGWYDAGDYNKYIVNSSITTYTLLLAYQINQSYADNFTIAIPETGNGIPDIINEALYNLRWMMTMQDPNDGGVYHKLTTKRFDDFIMPHQASKKRFVVQKSTAAALDFAATMSYASRVLGGLNSETTELSRTCLDAAHKAWTWAKQHPDILYEQPSDIHTGAYDDVNLKDEWFWAASEMYLSTGDLGFLKSLNSFYSTPEVPTWKKVGTLGVISLLSSSKSSEFESYQFDYLNYVDKLLEIEAKSAYHTCIDTMAWGSNSDIANAGLLKVIAYKLSEADKYKISIQNDLDYLFGRNATGYCFVTGFGDKSPMNIHHRPSATDDVVEPVPGFLIGGPNTVVMDDCGSDSGRSSFPAKSYIDAECSFSTNEIAINWNAPLVLLTTICDAYDMKD